jgi:tetratricopeptide (TPR) repeat protein
MYSRALDHFGVELQRAGDFKKAGGYFDLALQLNDANASAFINRDYSRQFQAGKRAGEEPSEGARQRLAQYGGSWSTLLAANGPIDEPNVCYLLAQTFGSSPISARPRSNSNGSFSSRRRTPPPAWRSSACAPHSAPGQGARAERVLRASGTKLTEEQELALLEAEAWAHGYKNDIPTTEKLLREAREKFPKQTTGWTAQLEIYERLGRIKEATELLNEQLKSQPTNVAALVNYAWLLIRAKQSSNAIPYLDRALQLNPKMEQARFNRALANLETGRLDAALTDYLSINPPSRDVFYGIGEIYFRKKNANKAREYFEKYLKSAPRGLPERRLVEERLKSLESGTW